MAKIHIFARIMELEYIKEGKIFHGHIPVVMGTRLDFLTAGYEEGTVAPVWEWLAGRAYALDAALSIFDPGSEVSVFNGSYDEEPVKVSPDLYRIVGKAVSYYARTSGLFDITLGRMPSLTVLPDGSILKTDPTVRLDFGGIAKGFLMSEVKEKLAGEGIGTAFVNFGDSAILGLGHHPYGDCWKVGIRNPFGGGVLTDVKLVDSALSTSGNTPGYKGHIVNPLTGLRNLDRKITCVQSPDPLEAEILSTVLMMADERQCGVLREEFPDAEMKIYNL